MSARRLFLAVAVAASAGACSSDASTPATEDDSTLANSETTEETNDGDDALDVDLDEEHALSCPAQEARFRIGPPEVDLPDDQVVAGGLSLVARPGVGDTWNGTLRTVSTVDGGGTVTLEIDLSSEVVSCNDESRGGWESETTITAVSLDLSVDGTPAPDTEQIVDTVESDLRGLTTTELRDDEGHFFDMAPSGIGDIDPDVSFGFFVEYQRAMFLATPTMPLEPVGPGSTWQRSSDDETRIGFSGREYDIVVDDVDGRTAALDVVLGGVIQGEGRIVVDTTAIWPDRAEFVYEFTDGTPGTVEVTLERDRATATSSGA